MRRALTAILVGMLVTAGLFGFAGGLGVGRASTQTADSGPGATLSPSLAIDVYDFLGVPWGEWWDYRKVNYGEQPVGADCFSQEGVNNGICSGTVDTFPYMNFYRWFGDSNDVFVFAPYRLDMVGVDQPGSTLSQPVILPVLNSNEPAGTDLRVQWNMNYIGTARTNELSACARLSNDGYLIESFVTVTMDLQTSKRIFGVTANNPAEAQAWWDSNINPECSLKGTVEGKWETFMIDQGGRSTTMGPYDIYNAFEWFYAPFITHFSPAVVDQSTGMTTVMIYHVAWGTEVLLGRWFYWGPSIYLNNAESYPHVKSGWWNQELPWFEYFYFDTRIGSEAQNFVLNTVLQYQLMANAAPGPDGIFHSSTTSSSDDLAAWLWMPMLADYIYGGQASSRHTVSEMDPYSSLKYLHANPGSVYFGTDYIYDLTPAEWDLGPADTMTIQAPTIDVEVVSPYSPLTSKVEDLVLVPTMIGFADDLFTLPAGSSATDTNGDGILDQVTLVGPIDWGAPSMPLWGFPALMFTAEVEVILDVKAELVKRAAWPEHRHFDISRHGTTQTLWGRVGNLGNGAVDFWVVFTVFDSDGKKVAEVKSDVHTLALGGQMDVSAKLKVREEGRFSVLAVTQYDTNGDGVPDKFGDKTKSFGFSVVE